MAANKGFTLIEVVVVIILVGILAAVAVPNFINSISQSEAQTAKSNLLAIAAGQQKYYEDYSSYCTSTTGNVANCGSNTADLNANLHLNIMSNDPFTYICTVPGVTPPPYSCTAQYGANVTLQLNVTTQGTTVVGSNVTCTVGGSKCPY